MNADSIGVAGGQVVKATAASKQAAPLGLSPEGSIIDSSPTLSNFSFTSQANTLISLSEALKSPVNLTLCSVALILVAGLWLLAGYFIQAMTPVYNSTSMLAYLSVTSLQIYFFFIPKRPNYPSNLARNESDLGLDTYTNREAFKIAGYLFILFTLSIGLIMKGLSLFPQSSYCGSVGLLALFALIFLFMGMKTESVTRFKVAAIGLLSVSALITIFEPVMWDGVEIMSFFNYGLALSFAGVLLLALFFVILTHQLEHTHIHKPMLFAFMGLFCMLVIWAVFIPLHIYNVEALTFPPSKEEVYWYIIGIISLGIVLPFYLIQWVLSRTSVLFVCVLLGSIIPLHGIAESIYFLEWNWVNLVASLFSVASILAINYHYK